MRKLIVFNSVSLDGFFTDSKGDMSFAHNAAPDKEWTAFVEGNAGGGGEALFGRITYELMAGYWPSPMAMKNDPLVAEGMNNMPKVVFSRTMVKAEWKNTRLMKDNLAAEVRKLKKESGNGIVIMGSGSIVSQLTEEGLIDEYQVVLVPVVLGKGRTMFDGVKEKRAMKLTSTRAFANGNVVLSYEPARP
jgi:dihydrofolate reductase